MLTGEFPPEVVYLKEWLVVLDIGNNLVYSNGSEFNPYLGELTELTELRTDQTNFQSIDGVPTEIGNLKKLEHYSTEACLYTGPLSGTAFPSDLAALTVLDIEANKYGSTVPVEIGRLPSLENLYLRASDLFGDLSYMVGMKSIFQTFVDFNPNLGGEIPPEIGNLSTLASLSVTECNFIGELPSELGNLGDSITNMFLFNNSLTGEVPEEWGALTRLLELQLQYNNFSGEIPASVCNLTTREALEYLSADCNICPDIPCCTECF